MARPDRSGLESSSEESADTDEDSGAHKTARSAYVFRINNEKGSGPDLVRQVLLERGWIEFDSHAAFALNVHNDWNFWWRSSHFRGSDYSRIRSWQRLNHFPGAFEISRKDYLARNMKRMKFKFPDSYNFVPESYHLPTEYVNFLTECSRGASAATSDRDRAPNANEREANGNGNANGNANTSTNANGNGNGNGNTQSCSWKPPNRFWICKPSYLSRGRGIHIFTDMHELQHTNNCIVQRYVHNPLLLFGYKFDCRIYVLVVSFKPLIVYVYEEGIVRFSTAKYDLADLKNVYAHLTNTSINKQSYAYTQEKVGVGVGCKWSLTRLRHFLQQNNYNTDRLWSEMIEIIVLTILCQAVTAAIDVSNCFELYGFDILIDADMKPWLLEVNFSPQLSDDCALDQQVKKPLISDLIDLLNFQESDKRSLSRRKSKSLRPLSRRQRGAASSAVPKRTFGISHSGNSNGFGDRPMSPLRRVATSTSLVGSLAGRRGGSSACESIEDRDYGEFSKGSTRPKTSSWGVESRTLRSPLQSELVDHDRTAWRAGKTSPERELVLLTSKPILPALASDMISMNRAAILRIYGPRLLSQARRVSSASQTMSSRPATSQSSQICTATEIYTSDNGVNKARDPLPVRARKSLAPTATFVTGDGDVASDKTATTAPSTVVACYELCQKAAQRSSSQCNSLYSNKSEQQQQAPHVEPPTRVGGFVLLYPFNAATKHAPEMLDDRLVVQQLRKCVKHEVRRQQSKHSPLKSHGSSQQPSWVTENLWDLA